jgi:hypothetical protein
MTTTEITAASSLLYLGKDAPPPGRDEAAIQKDVDGY